MENYHYELEKMNEESKNVNINDFYVWLINKGVPQEVVLSLKRIADYVEKISGKVYRIGKIILLKIWEFLNKHKELTVMVGLALVISFLVSTVPFIGGLLEVGSIVVSLVVISLQIRNEFKELVKNSFQGITDIFNEVGKEIFNKQEKEKSNV